MIVASSEMEELMYLSDTVVAMRGGRAVAQIARSKVSHEQLYNLMMADTEQN